MDQTQPPLPGTERSTDRKAAGRKAADGTEKTLEPFTVRKGLTNLMALRRKADAANDEYNDALKKLAEKAGFQASNINKLIKASIKGNFADVKRDVEQLDILFGEVGEAPGGGAQPGDG